MSQAKLMLPAGVVEVSRQELNRFRAPSPEGWWSPVDHACVLNAVIDALDSAGHTITRKWLAVGHQGHQFFGVLDLTDPVTEGVKIALALRNSTDKKLSMSICAGSRVTLCDNLMFRLELLNKGKNTRDRKHCFAGIITEAVSRLESFQNMEEIRLNQMKDQPLSEEKASHYLMRALEEQIISAPLVARIWREWRSPSFDFGPRTLWRLFNAITTVIGFRVKKTPSHYVSTTIRLNELLSPHMDEEE